MQYSYIDTFCVLRHSKKWSCWMKGNLSFSFFKKRFYLFIWEKEREHKQGQRKREKQSPRWAGSLTWALIPGPWGHVLSWMLTLNPLSHPGPPGDFFFHQRCRISLNSRMFWIENCWDLLHVTIPSSMRHSPDTPFPASIHAAAPHVGSTPPFPGPSL